MKNAVKPIVLSLLILVATLLVGGGCGSSDPLAIGGGNGMVAELPQRRQRVEANWDIYERQITDDWDLIWLMDDNSKLTEWYVSTAP